MDTTNERLIALLEDLVALTRFMAREGLERTLRLVLRDEKHKVAFELSDGTKTQSQVAASVGLSQPAVSELWKKWRRLGLLQERGGRVTRLVSLVDLGWDVPLPSDKTAGRLNVRTKAADAPERDN